VSTVSGLSVVNFITETFSKYGTTPSAGTIKRELSKRNIDFRIIRDDKYSIIHKNVNNVAIASIDSIDVIAIATDGGVVCISNDTTIVTIQHSGQTDVSGVFFDAEGKLWYDTHNRIHIRNTIPLTDEIGLFGLGNKGNSYRYYTDEYSPIFTPEADAAIHPGNTGTTIFDVTEQAVGHGAGLTLFKDYINDFKSYICFITNTHITGWTNLNTKGAFLSNSKTSDRSYNNNSLTEVGTITEGPVETGSELKSYSGFSGSNYLSQPFNSDLDFGTGDFHIMCRVKQSNTSNTSFIVDRSNTNGQSRIALVVTTSGHISFGVYENGVSSSILSSNVVDSGEWTYVCATRDSTGKLSITTNNQTNYIYADIKNVSMQDTNPMKIAIGYTNVLSFLGSLSLFRIGTGVPSDEQLSEIYNSERPLFRENSKCLLTSSTSAISSMSFDDSNNNLYVAGADNVDTFNGLLRIDSEVGAYTSISANNDYIAKGN
jgi:hypothetical protein